MEIEGLAPVMEQYLSVRRTEGDAPEASPELVKAAGELDKIYWQEVETILVREAAENRAHLHFTPRDRLLLDMGLLNWDLFPGGKDNRSALLHELYTRSDSKELYFSEWIAQRFRHHALYGGMAGQEGAARSGSRIIRKLRLNLYRKLEPLFENLPGFNRQAVDLFLGGRIDETLDHLVARKEDPSVQGQIKQLQDIRTRLVARARDRARNEQELSLFDSLRKLDSQLEQRSEDREPTGNREEFQEIRAQEREKFIRSELRLFRSLLRLGLTGTGLKRSRSVLLTSQRRIARGDLKPVMALVEECDATMPGSPSIVIAPYTGSGFYEWDRDTVFVPLVPVRSPDEAVVSALANYRIMLDSLQGGGALKKAYAKSFGEEDFQPRFVRDYRTWVLGIGRGFQGALDPYRFRFFRDNMGPQASSLYAPRDWVVVTPEEHKEAVQLCRMRINDGEAGFEDHYRLAVAYARDHQYALALQQLQTAINLNPVEGRILMALGHLSAQAGGTDSARKAYEECLELSPSTVWSVLAAEELKTL